MDEPLLKSDHLKPEQPVARFDRNTGKPLNDEARAIRQQKLDAAKAAKLKSPMGGAPENPAFSAYSSRTTGSIREQMLSQFPQVRENIDLVRDYDAAVMSEYDGGGGRNRSAKKKLTVRMMMIGPPGAGKSSYVNTARAVFSGKAWTEDAEVGMGHDTVTEVASSYPLLPDRPDHIRFTDTRGWLGLTDEAVGFFKKTAKTNIDHKTADMMSFEDVEQKKMSGLQRMKAAFNGVDTIHHVVIFFIDAHHIIRQPTTLPNVLDEIVTIYSSFKNSSAQAFEPVFFITKVDRVRQDIPTWELRAFVQEIVSRVNQHSQSKAASSNSNPQGAMPPNFNQYQQFNQGGHGSFGEAPSAPVKVPLIVRPNQFHEIRSCGSREDYEMLVHTNQWIEVQRLHANALAQVLPRAAALIRKELQRKQSEDVCDCCECCSVQ